MLIVTTENQINSGDNWKWFFFVSKVKNAVNKIGAVRNLLSSSDSLASESEFMKFLSDGNALLAECENDGDIPEGKKTDN